MMDTNPILYFSPLLPLAWANALELSKLSYVNSLSLPLRVSPLSVLVPNTIQTLISACLSLFDT